MSADPSGLTGDEAAEVRAGCYAVAGALLVSCSEVFSALHALVGNPARSPDVSALGPKRAEYAAANITRGAVGACLSVAHRLLISERGTAFANFPEMGPPSRREYNVTVLDRNARRSWMALVRGTAAAGAEVTAAQVVWENVSEAYVPVVEQLSSMESYLEQLAELLSRCEPER